MTDNPPSFTIEKDQVGLGNCVVAIWPDGRRVVVTGFGSEAQAQLWIERDSERWAKIIPHETPGEQWINNRLPKT